jgi:WhiB family transcriptional regulator, redox-sensing transcriptional regulator
VTTQTRRARPPRIANDTADDWRAAGLCRDQDPELWFPVGSSGPALLQEQQAKDVCSACPSRVSCRRYALDNGIDDGVWGGLGELERRWLRRQVPS